MIRDVGMIDVAALKQSLDWQAAVAHACCRAEPGRTFVGKTTWSLSSITRVLAASEGQTDALGKSNWIAMLRLRGRRFAFMSSGHGGWWPLGWGLSFVYDSEADAWAEAPQWVLARLRPSAPPSAVEEA